MEKTVVLYCKENARVELHGSLNDQKFTVSNLVLRAKEGSSAQFNFENSIIIPNDAITEQDAEYRLIRFSDLKKDAALIADYRAALHALAKIQLSHNDNSNFLGVNQKNLGDEHLFLELELGTLLDPGEGLVNVSGRLLLEAKVSLQLEELSVDKEKLSKQVFSIGWQLAMLFGAQFEVEVTFPTLQFSLPKLTLDRLNLPDLKWVNLDQLIFPLPKWFETFKVPISVKSTGCSASFESDSGFIFKANTIQLAYKEESVVEAKDVEINSNKGKESKAKSIIFKSLNIDQQEVKQPLDLPLSITAGPVCITPYLDTKTKEIALKVQLDAVSLSETTGSSLRFGPVSFQVKNEGISDFKATLIDGTASQELLIKVQDLQLKSKNAVASLAEWTVSVSNAVAPMLAKLLEFLRRLTLKLKNPQLPSVGPIRNAFAALLEFLQSMTLVADLSVQLVFDRSTHRLLRTVISARKMQTDNDGDDGKDVTLFKDSAFELELNTPKSARLALAIEHQGPWAGDWFLIAVPASDSHTDWFKLMLSSDLWLGQGEKTQLTQDTGKSEMPESPLLKAEITSKRNFAIALFGVQAGKPVWFQNFDANSSAIELDGNGQVRLALAEGGYRLSPIQINNSLNLNFSFDEKKAERLLPFLRKPNTSSKNDSSDLAQCIRLQRYDFNQEAQTITLHLEFMLNNESIATGSISGKWLLDQWKLQLEKNPKIVFSCTKCKCFDFLGLHWSINKKGTENEFDSTKTEEFAAFELNLGEEPELMLHPDASLNISKEFSNSQLNFVVPEGGLFKITRAGVSLDAHFHYDSKKPIELAGIKTKFEFKDAELKIRDSRVQEFLLGGSGALPAWIGDAKVDASFRFGHSEDVNGFELLDAWAQLQNPGKKVKAEKLRFEFSFRKIELAFKKEGEIDRYNKKVYSYEFYFLLSGSAEFKPNGGECDNGLLQYLKNAKLELNRTPVTSDLGKMLKSLEFTVPLPKPETINLFNLFQFEIRSIGFQCNAFGNSEEDHGIKIAGQCKFAELGDAISPEIDFHAMYIGMPVTNADGKVNPLPRIKFEGLRVLIKIASRIRLGGTVIAVDKDMPLQTVLPEYDKGLTAKGFVGDGEVEIPGIPPLSASFGFLEIEQLKNGRMERFLSWFVYIQVNKLSYRIPASIPLYIREIGFGLGYRYTLAAIAEAEKADTPAELIKRLDKLAKSQGDLARFSAWQPDVSGTEPKVTLAMRALLTMASASPPQTHEWLEDKEKVLPCPLTMDVVAALRSDFTYLMNVRIWLAVNYHDFFNSGDSLRTRPMVKGFMYLSGPKQEFMARLASEKNPFIGNHPNVPELVKRALNSVDYSATLYMRPGLLHFELGWPNQLRWSDTFGPLSIAFVGGFVFRFEDSQLLLGMNFSARGTLALSAQAGGSSFGASISALAEIAFTNRMIGVIDARRIDGSMYYGLVAIDLYVQFAVEAWLRFRKLGISVGIKISFSFGLQISAALELVLTGEPDIAGRARCRVGIRAFGRTLTVPVDLAHNGGKVDQARARVARYLDLGLSGPAEGLPDPFAEGAIQVGALTSEAKLQSDSVDESALNLNLTEFNVFARKLGNQPIAGVKDLVLVALIPGGTQSGFYCSPPSNQSIDYDYTWSGLPDGTYVFNLTNKSWEVIQNNSAKTSVNWDKKLGTDASLKDFFDNAFVINENGYVDPLPRKFDDTIYRSGAANSEQRGRDLHDSNNSEIENEISAANDARDLIMAQLLNSLVSFAENPDIANQSFCLDMGIVILIPKDKCIPKLLKEIKLERRDLRGKKCSVICDKIEFAIFEDYAARLSRFEYFIETDRLEFAWDLEWTEMPGTDGPESEPEEFLFAYEIQRQIEGDDKIGRRWLFRPADNVLRRNKDWLRQRAYRQFTDDFSDVGGATMILDATRGYRDIDYSITPLACDGSRGQVRRFTVRFEPPYSVDAPVDSDLEFELDLSKENTDRLSGISLHLRSFDLTKASLGRESRAREKPTKAELILRPERLRVGGHYGIDQDSEHRELLGSNGTVMPSDVVLHFTINETKMPVIEVADGESEPIFTKAILSDDLSTAAERLYNGRGCFAWRAYVRVSNEKAVSILVPVSIRLKKKNENETMTQVFVPSFEWPYATSELKTRTVYGYAGRVFKRGVNKGTESSQEVGTELRWSAFFTSTSDEPPVAAYRLFELPLDELPPRMLDDKLQPNREAIKKATQLAELKLCESDLLSLNPNHNRDTQDWDGDYEDCSNAEYIKWPQTEAQTVLPRVEPRLLVHLRTSLSNSNGKVWPSYIGIRVRPCSEKTKWLTNCQLNFPSGSIFKATQFVSCEHAVFELTGTEHTEQKFAEELRKLCIYSEDSLKNWPYYVEIAPMSSPGIVNEANWFSVESSKCHPDLITFAESLARESGERVEYQAGFEDEVNLKTVNDLIDATPESSDPLGSGILHRLGMAITLRIWNPKTRCYVSPIDLKTRIDDLLKNGGLLKRSIHIDLLLQTDQHWQVIPFDERIDVEPDDMEDLLGSQGLAMVQLSWRPLPCSEDQGMADLQNWIDIRGLVGNVENDNALKIRLKDWQKRFARYAPSCQVSSKDSESDCTYTRNLVAKIGSSGSLVAPDRNGHIRWRLRSKDLHAHVRSYAVAVVGRYDDLLFRVFGIGNASSRLNEVPDFKAWTAIRIDRSKALDPPKVVYCGHTEFKVENENVPVWEVAIGRHGEQSLSEDNDLMATRLQYHGIMTRISRAPRDPDWLNRINGELCALEQKGIKYKMPENQPQTIVLDDYTKNFEKALIAEPFKPHNKFYPSLWQGIDLLRYPALPYFYQHTLHIKARSWYVESEAVLVSEAMPDIFYKKDSSKCCRDEHGLAGNEQNDCINLCLGNDGLVEVKFFPTSYEQLSDMYSKKIGAEQNEEDTLFVRHAPDPDVQYELGFVDESAEAVEPLAHILRDQRSTGKSAYRSLSLSRRLSAEPCLRQNEKTKDPDKVLELVVKLMPVLQVMELDLPEIGILYSFKGYASYNKSSKILSILKPLTEDALEIILGAITQKKPYALEQIQVLEEKGLARAYALWQFSGQIKEGFNKEFPENLKKEYRNNFKLYGAKLKNNQEQLKDWQRNWLNEGGIWQSNPLRTELKEAIKLAINKSKEDKDFLHLSVLGVNFSKLRLPEGIELETPTETGRWLAFGPMTKELIEDISIVASEKDKKKIEEEALQRLLGTGGKQPCIRLRRWRGNLTKRDE